MKIFNRFVLVAASIAASCSGLLDVEPEGVIAGTNVLEDKARIEEALLGAYYGFGGISDGQDGGELFGGDFIIMADLLAYEGGFVVENNNIFSEIRWDDVNGPDYSNFKNKEILPTNLRVESNWRRAYEVINTINTIIANIENIENGSERDKILGEALAIRGIIYFELARFFAPAYAAVDDPAAEDAVPVITDPILTVDDVKTPELSSLESCYARAEDDLTEASSLLEDFGKNDVRLSYYACQAYLSRIALQKEEFDMAYKYADNVIASGEYHLASTPSAAFNNPVNSSEDILAIQQNAANNSGDQTTLTGITFYYSSVPGNGKGMLSVDTLIFTSKVLVNGPKFAKNDLRGTKQLNVDENSSSNQIDAAFYTNISNNNAQFLSPAKYVTSNNVIPVIRLAEMYLTRAEAIYEQNPDVIDPNALADLNTIRGRAGLNQLLPADFASPESFYDSLVIERKREFLFEGHLLHDLKRWDGRIGQGFKNPRNDNYVLPIPQSEIDAWN